MAYDSSHPRPISADSPLRPKPAFALYSMLPSAVKARIPSLRRSASMYGLTTGHAILEQSRPSSSATSPDDTCANAVVWSGGAEGSVYLTESGMETSEEEDTARPRKRYRRPVALDESKSGIGWKFAHQGSSHNPLSSLIAPGNISEQDLASSRWRLTNHP